MRIVSLIPSGTEIVAALGYGDRMVGRSHECDYPASVESLPICTAPKFDPQGTSAQIDERVREILQNALAVYRVDETLLKGLVPDVIVTQTQCDICAVSASDVQACVAEWVDVSTRIVAMTAEDLDGLWTDIETLASAIGTLEEGRELTARLKTRIADIAGAIPSIGVKQPTVMCLEWFDPLMTAGNWVPELVTMAGGHNLISSPGAHSGTIDWHDLRSADPDVIVLMPCGFDLERTIEEARKDLFDRPEWKQLRAVRNGAIYATNGNHYFNRPGPRLVASLEILVDILHPNRFHFGRSPTNWKQVP
jgi:iron complex transport system substrate-binding protein